MRKNIRKVMIEAAIILASIYLTFIIDVYTLNTVPKRVFVFCYFLLMGHVALFLKKKLQKGHVLPKYMLAATGILAAAIVLLGHNTFFPNVQETTVSLAAVPCEDGNCREVWFTAVQVDGQEIQLSKLELDANQGWTYRGDYDDYVFYPAEEADNTNYLTFQATGEEIVLTFAKNAWSGSVKVLVNEKEWETLSLTEENSGILDCTISADRSYLVWERLLYGFGAWIIITYFIMVLLMAIENINRKLFDCCVQENNLGNNALSIRSVRDKCSKKGIAGIALTLLFAVISVGVLNADLFYTNESYLVTVTSLKEKNPDCMGYEAEIQPIVNKMFDSSCVVNKDDSWYEQNGWFICTQSNQKITFKFESRHVNVLNLSKHPYAAVIQIVSPDGERNVDLFSEELTHETVAFNVESTRRPIEQNILLVLGVAVAVVVLFYVIEYISPNKLVSLLGTIGIATLLSSRNDATFRNKYLFILSISLVSLCYITRRRRQMEIVHSRKKLFAALLLFVSAYTSFALVGFELFLIDAFWDTSPRKFIMFLNVWLAIIPILVACLEMIEQVRIKALENLKDTDQRITKRVRIVCFGVSFLPLCLACIIFYPANMTADNVDQWLQALGCYSIYNAHPAVHTIFLRMCTYISASPITVTIFQALLFSYLISSIMVFFAGKGCGKGYLYALSLLVGILPNTIAMITCTSKNVMFAIFMLWLVFLVIRIFDDPKKFFCKLTTCFELSVVIAITSLLRHNAVVILLVLALSLLYLTIRYIKIVRIRPLCCFFAAMLIMQLITGPLYDYFKVERTGTGVPYGPVVRPYTTVVKYDVEIPEDTKVFLEKILPIDEYAKRYSPYNSDVFSWSEPRPNYKDISLREALHYYIKLLVQRPDIVIKDRLDGTNLIWDIFSHPGVRHDRYALGIWGSSNLGEYADQYPEVFIPERKVEDIVYTTGDGMTLFAKEYLRASTYCSVIDALLWRNGIYIVLMLIICVVAVRRRLYSLLAACAVPFAVLCTLLLVVGWQIYQYVWFFPLCITLCFSYMFFSKPITDLTL